MNRMQIKYFSVKNLSHGCWRYELLFAFVMQLFQCWSVLDCANYKLKPMGKRCFFLFILKWLQCCYLQAFIPQGKGAKWFKEWRGKP